VLNTHSTNANNDFIFYQRPDLWWSKPATLAHFGVSQWIDSIYVNGGTCNPEAIPPFTPRTTDECSNLRNISRATKTAACSAPSDMWATVPRRWASAYFTASTMVDLLDHPDESFPCNKTLAASNGLCDCLAPGGAKLPSERAELGLTPECLLGTWLAHHSAPWTSDAVSPQKSNANALVNDGALIGWPLSASGGPLWDVPPHCEMMPSNYTFHMSGLLWQEGIQELAIIRWADENQRHIYRNDPTLREQMWCNVSDPRW